MDVLLLALLLLFLAGIAAIMLSRWPRLATVSGAGGTVAACLFGLILTLRVLSNGSVESARLSWDVAHGALIVELDALGAFFLLPVFLLSALAALYGGDYLLAYRGRKSLGGPWLFFPIFVAGMVLVVVSRTTILFLTGWEVMSLAAFCLVTFEHEKPQVRRAGWVYLIATHLGVAVLFMMFSILGRLSGGLEFSLFRVTNAGWAGLIFGLALIGFGVKAGLVPLHVWLPEAHPAAPSHVSALMSGVMIKMGIYGLLRTLTFLGPPAPWWGLTLAAVGLLTALVGIALAVQQREIKRVLAYSSIENMGLIALALGVGLWGMASRRTDIAVLGLTATLLHVWNHALMKGMMFFAAGSVLHGTGSQDMEKLGGLMKRMPWTATAMMIGGVAISALPPLNGFVSKWLIYVGLLKSGWAYNDGRSLPALLGVGMLALVGGLVAFTFVRLAGIVLLGSPRSEAPAHAHESSWWLRGPMMILLCLCLGAAMAPTTVTGWLIRPLQQLEGPEAGATLLEPEAADAPLKLVGNINGWLLLAIVAAAAIFLVLTRNARRGKEQTWGCGYVEPTPRIQYTGRSFSEVIAEQLVPRFLRPRTERKALVGIFPRDSAFAAQSPDPVRTKVYEPFFRRWALRFARLRFLQQGKVNVYLLYIVVMVVLAFAWSTVRAWWERS